MIARTLSALGVFASLIPSLPVTPMGLRPRPSLKARATAPAARHAPSPPSSFWIRHTRS